MSRVELFERIRRDRRVDPPVSQRELMRRHQVSRRTVVQALAAALPPARKKPVRGRPRVLAPVMDIVDEMLRADLLRMSYSGKVVHRVFASQGQEAFMEGHVEAFRVLSGVPTRHIRYDNLKPAVRQVLFGRSRTESQRWVAFRSHYGFNAFYCLPGKAGAQRRAASSKRGGRFRRNHLVPPPQVASQAELNEQLAAIDAAEDDRHVHGSPGSIGFAFAAEAPLLHPLPVDDFDVGTTLTPTVRRTSRIVVRQCYRSRHLNGEIVRAASAIRLAVSVTRARRDESIQPWTDVLPAARYSTAWMRHSSLSASWAQTASTVLLASYSDTASRTVFAAMSGRCAV